MMHVTLCPQCHTSFVLRQAQLDVQQGKVRCGHCRHVFNALENLLQPNLQETAHQETTDLSSQTKLSVNLIESARVLHPIDKQSESVTSSTQSLASNTVASPLTLVAQIPVDTSFLDGRVKSYRRWPYVMMAILLILTAIGQTAYFLRSPITAHYTQLRPYVVKACEWMACDVPLPHDLALLTLEDSDMQEHSEYQGVLQFSTKLINHATTIQALPKLELTLTSLNDTPVLRRLFTPQEYLPMAKNALLAEEDVSINLNLTVGELPVAGYHVQLLY